MKSKTQQLTPTQLRAVAVEVANAVAKAKNKKNQALFNSTFKNELKALAALAEEEKKLEKETKDVKRKLNKGCEELGIRLMHWTSPPEIRKYSEHNEPRSTEVALYIHKLTLKSIDAKTFDMDALIKEFVEAEVK